MIGKRGPGHGQVVMCRLGQARSSFGAAAVCLAAATLSGCASSGNPGGVGGAAGTGGTSIAGSNGSGGVGGGSAGTGGVTGTGGVAGTGGASGTGGANSAGGSGGTAGSMDAGGTGGSAATGGTGGSAGAGGARGGSTGTGGRGGAGGTGTAGAVGTGGGSSACAPATPPTGGTKYCSNSKGSAGGGYAYELWSSGQGTGCMTVYGVDAKFSANWSNVQDFLARIGLQFDQTKTPAQIGTISSDFAETKTGNTGLIYVGIYGWTVSPLREYYIIDDWGSSKPGDTASDGTPRTHVGTITVDGDTYDVWKHTQTNKPAITGNNQTFDQYFSVRQNARQCGHISISQHFSQWTNLGLQLGNLEEAKLLLEAQNNSGSVDFTTATVVVK